MIEWVENQMKEAEWRNEGYVPTIEEHRSVAFVTAGHKLLTIASFVGMNMGDIVTEKSLKWALANPQLIIASNIICRNMDDIVGHKVHVAIINLQIQVINLSEFFFFICNWRAATSSI